MRVLPHVPKAGGRANREDACPTGKRHGDEASASVLRPTPVYLSAKPRAGAFQSHVYMPAQEGRQQLQSRVLGRLDGNQFLLRPGTRHVVEPLTPRKVGVFCPEILPLSSNLDNGNLDATLLAQPCVGVREEPKKSGETIDGKSVGSECSTGSRGLSGNDAAAAAVGAPAIPVAMRKQSSMRLCFEDLTFHERIGETGGQGGEVFSAVYRDPETQSEQIVAVKRFPAYHSTEDQRASLAREVHLMALVSSRCHHCVRYWGWCLAKDDAICLVMKRYQQSLHSKLNCLSERKMPLEAVQRYGKQIAQALSELHSQNILFLDLKPSNILLDEFDNIAVCDFGISRRSCTQAPRSGLHGSFNYMSPEAFDQETYGPLSTKSDVWSFACCIVEMVTGRRPWHATSMPAICFKVATNQQSPDVPENLPSALRELLQACFSHDGNLRPCFNKINHVFGQQWQTDEASVHVVDIPAEHSSRCAGYDDIARTVQLLCYDNLMVDISLAAAKRSNTLSLKLESEQKEDEYLYRSSKKEIVIILEDPSCTFSTISKVKQYLHTLLAVELAEQDIQDLRDVEIMINSFDESGTLALLMAADYLSIPELTFLACKGLNRYLEMHPKPGVEAIGNEFAARPASVAESHPAKVSDEPQRGRRVRSQARDKASGLRPIRSRSSPAKSHKITDGKILTTDQLLSDNDMRKLLPAGGIFSPAQTRVRGDIGLFDSLVRWDTSSWIDLSQKHLVHDAVAPSPARVKRSRPDETPPIPLKKAALLDRTKVESRPTLLAPPPTQFDENNSIHCTPGKSSGKVPAENVNLKTVHLTPQAQANSSQMPQEHPELFQAPKMSNSALHGLDFRRMITHNGDTFAGTCKGEIMHGIGVCWYANGDKYYGQWRSGMRHGIGRIEWRDGHMYEGSWREDIVCPGAKSKKKPKDKPGGLSNDQPLSPHPCAHRPPMSVYMFRARLSRMHGEDSNITPDPLAAFADIDKNPSPTNLDACQKGISMNPRESVQTRGLFTRVFQETQSVAGVLSVAAQGMGDFMFDMISQSPIKSPPANDDGDGDGKSSENANNSSRGAARLHYFRPDAENTDRLVEEEYRTTFPNPHTSGMRPAEACATSKEVFYVF